MQEASAIEPNHKAANGAPSATPPAPSALPAPSLDDPALYLNRELSWLEFNRRVLEEALDPKVPLLERLKFLAIFGSNLDEFFMVRVGGLQQKIHGGIAVGSGADRMPPREQNERIHATVLQMLAQADLCLTQELLPALEREGIVIRSMQQLTEGDRRHVGEVFRREVFPVLTPLAIDPGHPFPHLLNKSLNLAVLLLRPAPANRRSPSCRCPACCRASCSCRPLGLAPARRKVGAMRSRPWKPSSAATCPNSSPAWCWFPPPSSA